MNNRKNICYLLLADLIWGAAFVAQRTGGDVVGPYTFNCIRSFLGSAVLLPLFFARKNTQSEWISEKTRNEETDGRRTAGGGALLRGGALCGIALAFASNLQQVGITMGASVGKAGFLTACYILMVPLLGMFFHRSVKWNVWLGVFLSLIGLYLLCISERYIVEEGDILLLLCAFAFAVQILCIDHFSPNADAVQLSCVEFLFCGLCSAVPMCVCEISAMGVGGWCSALSGWEAWIPLLYAGICSSGIAYTLQIAGQKNFNPTVAALIMSLESVFSVVFGWLLLHETMSTKEMAGCVFLFAAVLLAQV